MRQAAEHRQTQKMSPRMYQTMELLTLPLHKLQQRLKQEMQSNPFLELEQLDPAEEKSLEELQEESELQAKDEEGELEWEEMLEGFAGSAPRASSSPRSDSDRPQRQLEAREATLSEYLLEQLRLEGLSEREELVAQEIVGNLSDAGFLVEPLAHIRDDVNAHLAAQPEGGNGAPSTLPVDIQEVEAVLREIQKLDPPGIAARDLRESLLLQLIRLDEEDTLAFEILSHHFPVLLEHDWKALARRTQKSRERVQEDADRIALLDPRPGNRRQSTEQNYVIPDILVFRENGTFRIEHNDSSLPRLHMSETYRQVIQSKDQFQGENKEFINDKINSARWMVQAIQSRRRTVKRVMEVITDRQEEFFRKGIEHLRPLTLQEVADEIDMHESTVSRVANEKYVQTPRGTYPLKFFFSPGLPTEYGQDISARAVKAHLKRLVDEEDPTAPLSDSALARRLKQEVGVEVARRTISKYRDQLDIPSSRVRKRV